MCNFLAGMRLAMTGMVVRSRLQMPAPVARRGVRGWPVLLGLVFVGLLSAHEVRACSCAPTSAPGVALEASTAVFAGEVVARRDLDLTEDGFPRAYGYTVRVYRAWKGVARETVEIGTPTSGTACGARFAIGAEYLFYVGGGGILGRTSGDAGRVTRTPDRPPFWTSSCARNVGLGSAEKEDFLVLGEPTWVNRAHRVSLLTDELWEASRQGDVAAIRQLVGAGHDVNGKPRYHYETALLAAVRGGHAEAAAALLEAGARVDQLSNDTTALAEAARLGDTATVRLLLLAGADANETRVQSPPLVTAIEVGSAEVVALLIDAGAEVDLSALTVAARGGHLAVVELLLPLVSLTASEPPSGEMSLWGASPGAPLMAAAYAGHAEVVDRLIAAGADVNETPPSGRSPLAAAAKRGHSDVVRRLLEAGAQVGDEEVTAASRLDEELARQVIAKRKAGAELEVTGEMLAQAAAAETTGSLNLLLERKPDVDAPGRYGDSALVIAAEKGRIGAVNALLAAGADIDRFGNNGRTALMSALSGNHYGIVKRLIDNGADPNAGGSDNLTVLMLAVRWSRQGLEHNRRTGVEAVDLLIEAGADVNKVVTGQRDLPGSGTALNQAIYQNNVELVRRFLDAGADPRLGGALCAAAWRGSLEISDLLLEGGASVETEDCAPLVLAAGSHEIDLVTRLLELGADPRRPSPGPSPRTAIHNAARDGQGNIVQLLIQHGADPNSALPNGFTPLHGAAWAKSIETAQILLEAGAEIDARRDGGATPLMSALLRSYRYVLEREERRRRNPDWIAPGLAMIEFLLEAGADVTAVDDGGRTAADIAEGIGDSAAAALLREAIAEE